MGATPNSVRCSRLVCREPYVPPQHPIGSSCVLFPSSRSSSRTCAPERGFQRCIGVGDDGTRDVHAHRRSTNALGASAPRATSTPPRSPRKRITQKPRRESDPSLPPSWFSSLTPSLPLHTPNRPSLSFLPPRPDPEAPASFDPIRRLRRRPGRISRQGRRGRAQVRGQNLRRAQTTQAIDGQPPSVIRRGHRPRVRARVSKGRPRPERRRVPGPTPGDVPGPGGAGAP